MLNNEFDADFFRYALDESLGWPKAGDYAIGPDYGQAIGLEKSGAGLGRVYERQMDAQGHSTFKLTKYIEIKQVFLPIQKTGPDIAVYKANGQTIQVVHNADDVHAAWHDEVKAFTERFQPKKKYRGPKLGAAGRRAQKEAQNKGIVTNASVHVTKADWTTQALAAAVSSFDESLGRGNPNPPPGRASGPRPVAPPCP